MKKAEGYSILLCIVLLTGWELLAQISLSTSFYFVVWFRHDFKSCDYSTYLFLSAAGKYRYSNTVY